MPVNREPSPLFVTWYHRLARTKSVYRLALSLTIALAGSTLLSPVRMEPLTRIMVGWDLFSFIVLVMIATAFFNLEPAQIRVVARKQDSSRSVVFMIVLVSSVTSLGAVLVLLSNKGGWVLDRKLETFIYLFGVACSWFLLHTIYALRYAHLYYGDHPNRPDGQAEGLKFPEETDPDYLDFAYFAFVLGMTFQVSDVCITSKRIRRVALLHGLLSFVFNTVIVALTINEVVILEG